MSACPACGKPVAATDWFCPSCAQPLQSDAEIEAKAIARPSVPGDRFAALEDPAFVAEVSNTLAWRRAPELLTGEALIVGEISLELSIEEAASHTYETVFPTQNGGLESLLLYADHSSTKYLSPSAVPRLTGAVLGAALTPYEQYLVTYINGRRCLRDLQEAGLLAPEEMSASILTLIDRGLVSLAPATGPAEEVERTEQVEISSWLRPELEEPELPAPVPRRAADRAARLAPNAAPADPIATPRPPSRPPALEASALIELGVEPSPAPPPGPAAPPAPPAEAIAPRGTLKRHEPIAAPLPAESPAPRAAPAPERPGHEAKAKELYKAALQDRANGNFVSARMNLKLAVAFAPHNRTYQALFRDLVDGPNTLEAAPRPLHPAAAKLFDEAAKAEANGELDRTIRLLERALLSAKEPVIMNRLGVILATRKRDLGRAQGLLEAAVELDPHNPAYLHNLSKVLSAAAIRLEERQSAQAPKAQRSRLGSFWDRLVGKRR